MQLIVTNENGDYDITGLVESVTWSGNIKQAFRLCEFELLYPMYDSNIPHIRIELGNIIRLYEGENELFYGYAVSRDRATDGSTISYSCRDCGMYLARNEGYYNFSGKTPEEITKTVCADFGIELKSAAETGICVSRVFNGIDLYSIIITAYNLAARKNGKKYMVRFSGRGLVVYEKTAYENTLILHGSSNLMSATYNENIENMVNRVAIHDKNGKFIKNIDNSDAQKLYGLMTQTVKQTDKDNKSDEANEIITENGVERKATAENFGDVRMVSGATVVVHEPFTELYGLFFIDDDTHTWKNGQYYNKLELNFRNIMDDKESGQEEKNGK